MLLCLFDALFLMSAMADNRVFKFQSSLFVKFKITSNDLHNILSTYLTSKLFLLLSSEISSNLLLLFSKLCLVFFSL